MLRLTVSLGQGNPCGADCAGFVDFWRVFWAKYGAETAEPVAVALCDGYEQGLTRNARKLAHRGLARFEYRRFAFNDHHQEIQAINMSKTETSHGPTYGWFTEAVPERPVLGLCDAHQDAWYGGFDEQGTLRGYWNIAILGRLGTSQWLFRHAEQSAYVLHGLIAFICATGDMDLVTYHTMTDGPHTGRPEFKRRIGFHETRLDVRP